MKWLFSRTTVVHFAFNPKIRNNPLITGENQGAANSPPVATTLAPEQHGQENPPASLGSRMRNPDEPEDNNDAKRQRLHFIDQDLTASSSTTLAHADADLHDVLLIDCGDKEVQPGSRICEVYSPPRIVPIARQNGLGPGWSLDITTMDQEGRPWNFDLQDCRDRARQLIDKTKPLMLAGTTRLT